MPHQCKQNDLRGGAGGFACELHLFTASDVARACRPQAQPSPQAQDLPRRVSMPSLAIMGTMTRPASGSAHHHPRSALSRSPPNTMAERYMQNSDCRASARMAPEPRLAADCRLALASRGITTTAAA